MRVLATIGFSFSAGAFLAALLPWNGWQLYAAGGVLLVFGFFFDRVFVLLRLDLPAERKFAAENPGVALLG